MAGKLKQVQSVADTQSRVGLILPKSGAELGEVSTGEATVSMSADA